MSEATHDSGGDDDPMQYLIGRQLRQMYDNVLSEPIPDSIIDLLSKLDSIPVPAHTGGDGDADPQ
ncbi:MAG: NepR family anti-sigma factor [Pseudomonadota bacterium]